MTELFLLMTQFCDFFPFLVIKFTCIIHWKNLSQNTRKNSAKFIYFYLDSFEIACNVSAVVGGTAKKALLAVSFKPKMNVEKNYFQALREKRARVREAKHERKLFFPFFSTFQF